MLSQEEINEKFVEMIPMLEKIVLGVSYKRGKKIEPHAAINEAYLYIMERQELLVNQDIIQRIVIQFINKSIVWPTSKLNKLEDVNNISEEFITDPPDSSEEDLESKIELENWYNEKLCTLELYRQQETSKIKRIIFDVYFNKGITKGVDLANHLNINKDYACRYIRELKQDIRDFEKQTKHK